MQCYRDSKPALSGLSSYSLKTVVMHLENRWSIQGGRPSRNYELFLEV